MLVQSGASSRHETCVLKVRKSLTGSLPLAFLIGLIMGDAFCFGESAIFARLKKELLVAAPSGSRAHDNCYAGDLGYNPLRPMQRVSSQGWMAR